MNESTSKWKRWVSLALGTAIAIVLLTWALQDLSWGAVWQSLARSHWGWFLVGWWCYLISYGVRAYRWGTLLAAQEIQSTFGQRLTATFIGFGANSILPGNLGEVIRAGLLHRSSGVPLETSLGTIVAERVLDIGVVLLFLILPLSLQAVPIIPGFNPALIVGLCGLLMLGWMLCILGTRCPQQTVRVLKPVLSLLKVPNLQNRLQVGILNFLSGLSALSQPQHCIILLLETLCVWLLNGVTYWTGLLALDQSHPGFWGALFIQSGTALAIAIPSTPGYIGPFEASLRILLGLYHIPTEAILSYAIALRFLMYVTIPVLATMTIFKSGLMTALRKFI
jgi:glycosyltransferase 2 family protein